MIGLYQSTLWGVIFWLGLKVRHLIVHHRIYCRGNNAVWIANTELLSTVRIGEGLMEYLEWLTVIDHVVGNRS